MAKFCPECGKPLDKESSKFCDDCGASLKENPSQPIEMIPLIPEEKNPFIAALCSFFIPGLGQVYDGEAARGIAIFIGTIVGAIFIIPGIIVWLFGMYDAYSIAKKMNNKEIPFKPTKTAHLILFIILACFIIALILFILFVMVMSAIFSPMAHSMGTIK